MKKLICVILAVLLLAGCAKPSDQEGTAAGDGKLTAQIGGEQIEFVAWEGEGLPTEGAYYLTASVVMQETVEITGDLKLHLAGQTISSADGVVIKNLFKIPEGKSMTVYDAPDAAGKIVSARAYGMDPAVTSMFLVSGKLTVAGGSIDASPISIENLSNGLVANVQTGGEMNILGGVITGGTTWRTAKDPQLEAADKAGAAGTELEDSAVQEEPVVIKPEDIMGKGGCVYVAKGAVCKVSGGTLQEGSAAQGGNIFVEEDEENPGKLEITGGRIFSGEALYYGGNIYVAGEMAMSNGSIDAGECFGNGGNIFVQGKLEVTGGEIIDGICDVNSKLNRRGGNILVNGTHAYVSLKNAKILGGKASGKENYGGNISVTALGAEFFEMSDCILSEGYGHRGGNFYIGHLSADIPAENLDYTITNTVFEYGTTTYRGANICVDTKNKERPIILNMTNCDLVLDPMNQQDNIAIGAGAYDNAQCHVTMDGGSIVGGVLTIYGFCSLTLNGTDTDKDQHTFGGDLIINPAQ